MHPRLFMGLRIDFGPTRVNGGNGMDDEEECGL